MEKTIEVLDQEIKWHNENKGKHPDERYAPGFINGMKHIRRLLVEVFEVSEVD